MTDPRKILLEAKVECPELDRILGDYDGRMPLYDWFRYDQEGVDELVGALVRLIVGREP